MLKSKLMPPDASQTSQTHIALVRTRDLPQLKRLFEQAVRDHFAYFPAGVQNDVIRGHSLIKLAKAKYDPRRIVLVARRGPRIVGYCIAAVPSHGPSQLFWLYVEPDHRGINLGLSLLSRTLKLMAAKGARDIFIATHDHRRYYERQGFKFSDRTIQQGIPMDIMVFKVQG
jgi:ribosomal protein S18 acetylase RimI-like enzyme